MKIAIIAADFYKDLAETMITAAKEEIEKNNAEVSEVIQVPGAFEIPFATNRALNHADAAVTLGAVIQGKTAHDIVITESIAPKILDISISKNKPVGFGVIGPRVTKEQADKRAKEYAQRAVQTVLVLSKIKK